MTLTPSVLRNLARIFLAFTFTFLAMAITKADEVQPVPHVDLNQYLGTWYELASIPQSFQKDCAGQVTASYGLGTEGTVTVLNQCQTTEGTQKTSMGNAKVVDPQSNAKLKVSFFKFLGHWIYIFGGDYWVIDLAPDYHYAVVGHPTRKYAWVLSRTVTLSKEDWTTISNNLKSQGYDTCLLMTTIHTGGEFSSRQPLCKVIP